MIDGLKRILCNCFLVNARWILRPRRRHSAVVAAIAIFLIVTLYISTVQNNYFHTTKVKPLERYWVHRMYGSADVGNAIAAKWNYSDYNGTYNSYGDWVNPGLDILHTEPFHFLPNYKNPCWYQTLHKYDAYKNNKYTMVSRSARIMSLRMMKEWSRRLAAPKTPQRLRCLPYFLVIGQPKSGSTDIFHRLVSHPDVEHPPIKELHWWSRNRQGRNVNFTDIIPLSHYIDMFDEASLKIEKNVETNADPEMPYHPKVTGEASVSIFWENDDWYHYPENRNQEEPLYINPDYIHHVIPDVKLILILRNPTDRLFSDFLYFKSSNKSAYVFHKHVQNAVELYTNCTAHFSTRFCIYSKTVSSLSKVRLRLGMYESYLKDWFRVFPREQILIIRLEDYSKDIHSVLTKVYDFLGLRRLPAEDLVHIVSKPVVNKRKKKDRKVGKMFEETRLLLDQFYAPYNQRLAKLLKNNDFLWGAPVVHLDDDKNEATSVGENEVQIVKSNEKNINDDDNTEGNINPVNDKDDDIDTDADVSHTKIDRIKNKNEKDKTEDKVNEKDDDIDNDTDADVNNNDVSHTKIKIVGRKSLNIDSKKFRKNTAFRPSDDNEDGKEDGIENDFLFPKLDSRNDKTGKPIRPSKRKSTDDDDDENV